MKAYDPRRAPDAAEWLASDEGERSIVVEAYHRRNRVRLPNAILHVNVHVVVENQFALGVDVVVDTLARLGVEGLGRHDALHAIGSVLMGHMYELLKGQPPAKDVDPNQAYFEDLRKLTAASWRNSG